MSRRVSAHALAFSALFLSLTHPAAADGAPVTMQSMRDFLKKKPGCLEFTDQCSICRRDGETVTCSTPSIACIKKDYACTKTDAE
ncbi:hypothetical protein HHL25_10520 [Rhizobium sp. S-51]|uniref:Uncharacterized protein n=1 Tax=Rhizobium terricola TaxID=2728849 RepID=A0A7Y0AW65_9HYPH|nr:hypothetical protein [Rhizobium terricola]NML74556.1 hypothetical protein [Rhizobium terricola]